MAVAIGFLKGGDILVLDNASIHGQGGNTYLKEWRYVLCERASKSLFSFFQQGSGVEPDRAGMADAGSASQVLPD
jgi:hypothetical protein